MTPRAVLLSALPAAFALAACGGGDDGGTGPADPTPASVIQVQGDAQTGEVGKALPENPTVEVRDASGNPLENESVSFEVTSGGGSVSTSSTTTDIRGRASVTWTLGTDASATHRLEVTAGSASTTFTAQARPAAPSELRIVQGDDQAADPGSPLPLPLVVRVVDRFENGVPDVTVTFDAEAGEVSPAETTTDAQGEARTTGTVGTLDELSGDPTIVPSSLDRARRTVEYDERLKAARSTAFSATAPGLGAVTFEARVRSGSGTSWSLSEGSLPPGLTFDDDGRITGVPDATGEFRFTVRVQETGGSEVSESYTLKVCEEPLALQPGEVLSTGPPRSGECGIFLPSGARGDRYRVAVAWPSSRENSDAASVTLKIRGEGVTSSTVPPFASRTSGSGSSFTVPLERIRPDLERMEATDRVHRRLLAGARDLSARLGRTALLPDRRRAARAASRSQEAPEMRTFNVPANSCSTGAGTLRAEKILESEQMVAYQDSAQRAETPVDSSLVRRMADFYDGYGEQVTDDYFGGISDVDGNGKFLVLITPFEDTPGGDALAFVLARDFFTTEECSGSNEAEMTYFSAGGIKAMESGASPQSFQALGALVHEVKHISSLYKRIEAGDLGGRPIWIEEGTADVASELASRLAWHDQDENPGPALDETVTRRSFEEVTPNNWGVLIRMARTATTLASQPNALTENPTDAESGHTFYGSSWHFHRFLADAYRGGLGPDSAFFRRQNAQSADPGVGFLESELGRSFDALLEEHAVATMVNGHSAAGPVERTLIGYSFPSAAEVFCSPNPLGVYPWPVTTTGERKQGDCRDGFDPEQEDQTPTASFATATFEGPMGHGGMRIHDFLSNGTGQGAEINVDVGTEAASQARVVVVRLN